MTTETEICNVALTFLGEEVIGDIADNVQCVLYYPTCRDHLLRKHTWNFAEKRQTLAQITAGPIFEFKYKFQLPNDYIKVIRLYNDDTEYRIEGKTLLTNSSSVKLIYTARIIDPNVFDSMFITALQFRLASYLAIGLKQSNSLFDQFRNYAEEEVFNAQVKDSQEGTPIRAQPTHNILSSRRGRRR